MIPWVYLAAATLLAGLLARRLCGDSYSATLAAAIYALAPATRVFAQSDSRLAASLALLPFLIILFYRAIEVPQDSSLRELRMALAYPALCLAFLGVLDPRLAIAWSAFIWTLLLAGYLMNRRHWNMVWWPPFSRWTQICLGGICLYAPLWWWRLRHFHKPLDLAYGGADFLILWRPSSNYLGIMACLLALSSLILSRSYRSQARLWGIVSGMMLWLNLGADMSWNNHTLRWIPALYRLIRQLPWLGSVPPSLFAPLGQLGLGILAAFGFSALLARMPSRGLIWSRRMFGVAALILLALDYMRS